MSSADDIDFSKSALIVWDMQGAISRRAFNYAVLVSNIRKLLDAAHARQKRVIYSRHVVLPRNFVSQEFINSLLKRGISPDSFLNKDSKEWKIPEEIAPTDADLVLEKHTPSFFVDTMLDYLLRDLGIKVLLLTGVSTEIGVEGTARHASHLGYKPVIVEDATGSSNKEMHELSLKVMRGMFPVLPTEKVVEGLQRAE